LAISEGSIEKSTVQKRSLQALFLVLICLCIVACEYIFAYHNAAFGIGIGLALVILIYTLISILPFTNSISRVAESLSLIPLYILFTSSLPWFFLDQQYLIPAVYACVLALAFWHIFRNDISLKEIVNFDYRKLFKYLILALVIGFPLGTVEYLILMPSASSLFFEAKYLIRDIVYMLLFVGLGEELLFRGLIQRDLMNIYGWKWGLVVTSFLFAVMHMTWRSIPELFFVFAAALILGGLYIRTKSLVLPILVHAINNIVLVSLMPYILGK
jgi:uncharacterized protein